MFVHVSLTLNKTKHVHFFMTLKLAISQVILSARVATKVTYFDYSLVVSINYNR